MSSSPEATADGWQEAERGSRERSWDVVERFFADVPSRIFPRTLALRYELGLWYSRSGDLKDALRGTDRCPLLSIAIWVLDDLRVKHGPEREHIERQLMLASVLLLGLGHMRERSSDAGSFYSPDDADLAELLRHRVKRELGTLPNEGERPRTRDVPADPSDLLRRPRWSAAVHQLTSAAATFAGRTDTIPELDAILDDLAAAFQIRTELTTVSRDLMEGRLTYPIAVLAAGSGLERVGPMDTTRVLGQLVLSTAFERILDAAIDRLERSLRRAEASGLRSLASYVMSARDSFAELRRGRLEDTAARRIPILHRAEPPPLRRAIEMAEGYLLADTSFRASWETHRDGMFGSAEVASRFPAGLILEILARHGHDVRREINRSIGRAVKDRFRYYSHRSSATDTDTLGVVLRLAGRPRALGPHRRAVEAAVRCVEREVAARGSVPVWLSACDGATADAPPQILLGEGCATVQAHFLIGLTEFGFGRHRATIETAVRSLCGRIAHVGLGANLNYPPLYALGTFVRLAVSLERRELDPELRRELAVLRSCLARELESRTALTSPSAQEAALAISACDVAARTDLIRPGWTEAILKRQSFDGSWPAEPFAAAPNRGRSITPYATVPLTTALCYDALRRTMADADGVSDTDA